MTSDEALIEKMAEAINEARLHQLATSTELARAALSVVRENDKMVQAGSTGAVRSTDLSGIDLQPGDSVVCLVSDGDLLVAGNHYTVSMLPKAHYVALTAFPGVFFQAGRFEYAHTNVLLASTFTLPDLSVLSLTFFRGFVAIPMERQPLAVVARQPPR